MEGKRGDRLDVSIRGDDGFHARFKGAAGETRTSNLRNAKLFKGLFLLAGLQNHLTNHARFKGTAGETRTSNLPDRTPKNGPMGFMRG